MANGSSSGIGPGRSTISLSLPALVALCALTLAIGAGVTTQGGVTAKLGQSLGSAIYATGISFALGMFPLMLARYVELLISRRRRQAASNSDSGGSSGTGAGTLAVAAPKPVTRPPSWLRSPRTGSPTVTRIQVLPSPVPTRQPAGETRSPLPVVHSGNQHRIPDVVLNVVSPHAVADSDSKTEPPREASEQGSTRQNLAQKSARRTRCGCWSGGLGRDSTAVSETERWLAFKARPRPYQLFGGSLGFTYVVTAVFLIPELGFSLYTVCLVAGQLMTSVAFDHIGFLGSTRNSINKFSTAGCFLVVIGAALAGSDTIGEVSAPIGLALLYCLLVIASGSILVLQAAVNAEVAMILPTKLASATLTFIVGTLTCIPAVIVVFIVDPDSRDALPDAIVSTDWWKYSGFCFGICLVTSGIVLPRLISFGTYSATLVCGQLATSLLYDSLGILRDESSDPTPMRVIGLVVVGIAAGCFAKARMVSARRRLVGAMAAVFATVSQTRNQTTRREPGSDPGSDPQPGLGQAGGSSTGPPQPASGTQADSTTPGPLAV